MHCLRDCGFNGILADDMGLGKTLQVIDLLESIDSALPSIVVCPSSLVYNWESEVHKFSKKLHVGCIVKSQDNRKQMIQAYQEYDLLVTSYDYMRRDYKLYEGKTFEYVILDEAQYIKNQKTLNARTVKKLQSNSRLALTGTPIENSLAELWSIFDFLMPQYLFNYHYFVTHYENDIVKNHDKEKTKQLKKLVSPFILRRNKKDVLPELPDKIEKTQLISFDDEEYKIYLANLAQVNSDLQEILNQEKVDNIAILSMLTKLRQLCCEPRLVYENIHTPSSKLMACMEIIENIKESNQKILLFSSFTSMLDLIAEQLNLKGISYYMLTGQTSKEKRKDLVDRFQNDSTTVFLISLKAGGTGLNLTAAQMVIHYDPWWNVSAQNQATDRAYRIGQTNKVQEIKLVMKDSVEKNFRFTRKEERAC
ncbi:MAG: DEAD/DEAH box helicase [Erysipelotrichaceae bacterium]|nr:DEAD/DEAH box helicase [Erysipelotrichaceae bacterium]